MLFDDAMLTFGYIAFLRHSNSIHIECPKEKEMNKNVGNYWFKMVEQLLARTGIE